MSEGPRLTPLAQSHAPYFIGIDVGGTGIKIGLVDDRGQTLGYSRILTEVERGPLAAVERIGHAVKKTIAGAGLDLAQIDAVGLATPGTMDIPRGMFLNPVNLPGWDN